MYGYGGDSGMPYMGVTRQPQRRSRRGGCLSGLLVLILIVVVFAFIGHLALGFSIGNGPTVIPVSTSPTVIIEAQLTSSDDANLLHIHGGGPAGQISVQTAMFLNLPLGFAMGYQESSDHNVVILDMDSLGGDGTLNVTVPTGSAVKISANSDPILVENVTGQLDLATDSSTLVIQNSTLTALSFAQSDSGTIKLLNVKLSGSTNVDNDSGDIVFQGSVENGTNQFTENNGELDVTLQAGTATHIDATTNQGNITSTIPGAKAQQSTEGGGLELHTQVGTSPLASLTLDNNQGNITINEQGGL
jgi:hypothetical protein